MGDTFDSVSTLALPLKKKEADVGDPGDSL